jgi:hypothetical protein
MIRFENHRKIVYLTEIAELTFYKTTLDTYIRFGINQENLIEVVKEYMDIIKNDSLIKKEVFNQRHDHLYINIEDKTEFEGVFNKKYNYYWEKIEII